MKLVGVDTPPMSASLKTTNWFAGSVVEAETTPESLAKRLASLLAAPDILATAAKAARRFGERDAARRLADLAEELAGRPKQEAA